ncbi:phosphoglycerate mutase-like protein [Parathielavia appendiculata]|uniref:Phosphoglycerate mutase-like protein n=1 Tax=Parathielavia appendiculata TaxID=2587402 RepID=A0AAN6TY01_9PEZI|nr:phosphoglycerate mutase-like protein [Parathielavia appendiculata]
MGRPRLIILIRHAQSEGNKNRDIHQTIPDHRVKLTQEGWQQAYEAGRRLRAMLRADDTLHFFTSPYRRTRETTEGILATLTSDDPEPSPFKRNNIKVYEEPRLREQDFGNFQPCSAEMERMWQERADYGHFFYRIPNGESAADAYDRISGFNESLWRQFGEDDFASVCVLVTHGLMSRVFLMKWYHFSVEYFEDLRNVNHCEFLVMRRNDDNGKYILENKLRTWSELKRERAEALAREKGEGGKANGTSKDATTLARAATVEVRRRWGGCPNGCTHDKSFKIRPTLADLVKSDNIISNHAVGLAANEGSSTSVLGGSTSTALHNGSAPGTAHGITNLSFEGTANSHTIVSRRPAAKRFQSQTADEASDGGEPAISGPQIDVTRAHEDVVSSPDGTPSFISVDDRIRSRLKSPNALPRPLEPTQLHVGRDFGGTYSGHNSGASDDADSSSEEDDDGSHRRGAAITPSPCSTTPIPSIPSCPTTTITTKTSITAAFATTTTSTNPNGSGAATHQHQHQPQQKPTLGVPPAALPHRHRRERSRMGRGMRANRLGDHHSSDGEHEADGECEPCNDDDEADEESGREMVAVMPVGEGVPVPVPDNTAVTWERADEADEVLAREEREDRSTQGSVY